MSVASKARDGALLKTRRQFGDGREQQQRLVEDSIGAVSCQIGPDAFWCDISFLYPLHHFLRDTSPYHAVTANVCDGSLNVGFNLLFLFRLVLPISSPFVAKKLTIKKLVSFFTLFNPLNIVSNQKSFFDRLQNIPRFTAIPNLIAFNRFTP